VRFSPDGETLASASDDTSIILWKDKGVRSSSFGSAAPHGEGTWSPLGVLRGHCADVYDISWSPDGQVSVKRPIRNSCTGEATMACYSMRPVGAGPAQHITYCKARN
jgi:chromatin assembly factor 1 subunit B